MPDSSTKKETVDYAGDLDMCIEEYFTKYINQKHDGDSAQAMRFLFEKAFHVVFFVCELIDPKEVKSYLEANVLEDEEAYDNMLTLLENAKENISWFAGMQRGVRKYMAHRLDKSQEELSRMADIATHLQQ